MVAFLRPVGAKADLCELEYVSALHQTQDGGIRRDGSVRGADIQLFLKSRYGLEVSLDDVHRTVVEGFTASGGCGDAIDLSELASMLLIPILVKAAMGANDDAGEPDDDDDDDDDNQVLYPKPGLIEHVLSMIVRDVTGSTDPPRLSESLLRDILLAYGEKELSCDAELLKDMLHAAGGEEELLTVDVFSRALTADLGLYDVRSEARLTTNYHDVMEVDRPFVEKADEHQNNAAAGSAGDGTNCHNAPAVARKFRSTPAIDFTSCRYSSKYIAVLLWTGFIINYVAYFALILRESISWHFGTNESLSFGTRIGYAVLEWLFVLATLCGFGLSYVALGSCGNGIDTAQNWSRVVAIIVIGLFTWTFFLLLFSTQDEEVGEVTYFGENGPRTEVVVQQQTESYDAVIYFISLIVGTGIMLLEVFLIVGDTVVKPWIGETSKQFISFFTSTGIKAEAGSKQAAAHKVNALVDNAREIHSSTSEKEANQGQASFAAGLLNFSVAGDKFEEAGGFVWTWKKIIRGELSGEEGVLISARLLAGNFAQLLISMFIMTYGVALTRSAGRGWQENTDNSSKYLLLALEWFNVTVDVQNLAYDNCFVPDSAVSLFDLNTSACTTVSLEAITSTLEAFSDSLYPDAQYMVEIPMIVATAVALASCLLIAAAYIPSVASTTLQFRTGVTPFFRDKDSFAEHRSQLDQVTILLGSMFWGALYASGFLGVLVGTIVFLFLWQATREFFVNFLATVIAILCTIVIKILIAVLLLRTAYAGFFRKKVNQVNIASLAQECIMVGLAVGTALVRAVKLFLISAMYIGRVDTPLLAPGVGLGRIRDRLPLIFRQDILALEAHRHPYLEHFGKMYLMKLRHGDRFASRAGNGYRLVFTVALMPWLRQYRVAAGPSAAASTISPAVPNGGGLTDLLCANNALVSSLLFRNNKKDPQKERGASAHRTAEALPNGAGDDSAGEMTS